MDASDRRDVVPRVVVGLGIAAVGPLMLLERLGLRGSGEVLRYWPVIVIAFGVAKVFAGRFFRGTLFALGGGWLLLHNLGWVAGAQLWPVLLVLLGVYLITRELSRHGPTCGCCSCRCDEEATR